MCCALDLWIDISLKSWAQLRIEEDSCKEAEARVKELEKQVISLGATVADWPFQWGEYLVSYESQTGSRGVPLSSCYLKQVRRNLKLLSDYFVVISSGMEKAFCNDIKMRAADVLAGRSLGDILSALASSVLVLGIFIVAYKLDSPEMIQDAERRPDACSQAVDRGPRRPLRPR
ncbi:hypothetical protein POM88_013000 [Heracleum sosnowskyi]|uniref:Uncharacterized protein n=1 Tax=Heracleum sosnowskyi TaxID=360622 RepID=A0AAD8IZ61_9APIA|nr:hypothetical protein POM88_013000 [Heracleum sosnowskyi]